MSECNEKRFKMETLFLFVIIDTDPFCIYNDRVILTLAVPFASLFPFVLTATTRTWAWARVPLLLLLPTTVKHLVKPRRPRTAILLLWSEVLLIKCPTCFALLLYLCNTQRKMRKKKQTKKQTNKQNTVAVRLPSKISIPCKLPGREWRFQTKEWYKMVKNKAILDTEALGKGSPRLIPLWYSFPPQTPSSLSLSLEVLETYKELL